MPILEGSKTVLRNYARSDFAEQVLWERPGNPLEAVWHLRVPHGMDPDEYYAQRILTSGEDRYAVDDREGRLVGVLSLREVDRERGRARLGIVIHRAETNKGFGTDAIRTLCEHVFMVLGYSKLVLDVARANPRALRCYEKCGFVEVGDFWREVSIESIDRPEFRPHLVHFRIKGGRVQARFVEMELNRVRYMRGIGSPASLMSGPPASDSKPKPKRPAPFSDS